MSACRERFVAALKRLTRKPCRRNVSTLSQVPCEHLESRQLLSATSGLHLAGDVQSAADTQPVIDLQVQFKRNGAAVTHIDPGQEFQIEIAARDMRNLSEQYVALVYFDVLFDSELIDIQSTQTGPLGIMTNGTLRESDGILDEVEVFNFDTSGTEFTALILNAVAIADGSLRVSTRAAESGVSSVYSERTAIDVSSNEMIFGSSQMSLGSPSPASMVFALPDSGGQYQLLLQDGDLVLRAESGVELLRRSDILITDLFIVGSAHADYVTVGSSGNSVHKPVTFSGGDGDDQFDATGATGGVTLFGDSGNDTLLGGTGGDDIRGGVGNDRLFGGDGKDAVSGDDGADLLAGGDGDDTLNGGNGIDSVHESMDFSMILSGDSVSGALQMALVNGAPQATDALSSIEAVSLRGGTSNNRIDASAWISPSTTTLIGGGGRDTIIGSPGRDRITTFSSGRDSIQGGAGNDTIATGNGDDTIDGGDGNDSIQGQSGNDLVIGGMGDDNLAGSDGNDTVIGGEGNDKLFGLQDDDLLDGGNGNDSLTGSSGDDTLLGGAGKDLLRGDAGTDSMNGGGGVDRIDERINADVTIVGTQIQSAVLGNESPVGIERILLTGGSSGNLFNARLATVEVLLTGNGGNDTLLGGSESDTLRGNDGNDVLSGDSGTDLIEGGAGTDFWFESANVDFTVSGLQMSSTAIGTETGIEIERIAIEGGVGNNNLNASAASVPVLLLGGLGNDTLLGGSGPDTLSGGFRGDSTVAGSDGLDSLTSGAGADTLKSDPSDTFGNTAGDTLQADLFSLLPDWLDLI